MKVATRCYFSSTMPNQEAKRGDKLMAGGFEHPEGFELVPATSQRGAIVGDLHDHDLLGKYDVVILDLGGMEVAPGTVWGFTHKVQPLLTKKVHAM